MKIKNIGAGIILSVCILSFQDALSQNEVKKLPSVMTPEAANLGKYGTYNVNYHTGSPNISLPLYSFNEDGVNVALSLGYDASGFVPNKSSGATGLNWNLSSGGAITRIVNGQPDEKNNPDPSSVGDQQDHTNIGYIYGITHNLGTYASEYIRSLQFLNMSALGSPGSNIHYEYEPDQFSFNFLGHSGTFFMDNSGQIRVQSDRRYKVDMTEFTGPDGIYDISTLLGDMTNTEINEQLISRIRITSDDGYVFYFGGTLSTLELGFSYPTPASLAVDGTSARINAWYLTRIQTPDGKNIYYNYQPYSSFDCNTIRTVVNQDANNGLWNNYVDGNDFFEIKLGWNDGVKLEPNGGGVNTINSRVKSLTKLAYLKEIISGTQKISFLYSEKDRYNHFYTSNDYNNYIVYNPEFFTLKLDKILVQDLMNISPVMNVSDGSTTYSVSRYIEFFYDYLGTNAAGWRLSLNHVSTNAPSVSPLTYSFNYYDLNYYPDPMTKGLDLWGFYNGTSNTTLSGQPNLSDPELEIDFNASTVRTPTQGNTTSAGFYSAHRILNKITYPTGGYTEFVFENNEYRKIVKRKISSGVNASIDNLSSNQPAGGLRIKKITNNPGTTLDFYYKSDYNGANTTSSGILLDYEVNFLSAYAPTVNFGNGNYFGMWSDNNLGPAASYQESHIEYAQVQEVPAGNGYTNYTYSTFETNPDIYNLGSDAYLLRNPDYSFNNFNNQLRRLFKYSARPTERGKLLKQEVFNQQNVRLSYIENTYNTDPARLNERGIAYYKYVFIPELWLCNTYANYYYHNNLTQQVSSQYDAVTGNTLSTVTTYTYKSNSNPLLIEKKTVNSDNTEYKTKYKYPEDFPSDPVYTGMTSKFMVGTVIEESAWKGTQLLKTTSNNYYLTSGSNLYKLQSVTAKNDLLPVSANNPYELIHFYQYDLSGHLTEAAKGNNLKMAYKWDYNNTRLVAEIQNASATAVSYTSFETAAQDGWSYSNTAVLYYPIAPMGAKVFALNYGSNSYNITRTISLSSKAILSLWFKGSSINVSGLVPVKQFTRDGWNYREYELSTAITSINISGAGLVDELRLYPQGSQIQTYAYDPMYGITSHCDPNNRIVTYEYDGLGRLRLIRDMDKKIMKKYCYNYSGQAEDCNLSATPQWVTVDTYCQPCAANANYLSGHLEEKQVDMNLQTNLGQRLVDMGVSPTCVTSPDWQTISTVCQQVSGENTGYQTLTQQDMNPCTNAGTRQIQVQNNGACPLPPCAPSNCSGKCINGVCDPGTVVVISTQRERIDGIWYWRCYKARCYSDGTYDDLGDELSLTSCLSQVVICQ